MKQLLIVLAYLLLTGCAPKTTSPESTTDEVYTEQYRPAYHFSPAKNWTNDPNGLVYYDGEYHIFYQYNPYGDTWGHMTWGHAVSKDLLHWEHLPNAIGEYPDPATGDSTMIFSGTVVVDENNTSGLCKGKDCMVAVYTSHVHAKGEGKRQHESLAFSDDHGRTWKRYDKNPVLDIQRKDFRDPKMFWYGPHQQWVMVLVIPDLHKVQCYESKNLTQWKLMSEFGPLGDTLKIWECPDLYELQVSGSDQKRWVLSLSCSHPQGPTFVGVQYFIGKFDGTKFTPDDSKQRPLYVDYGKDFYAGIVYNHLPKENNNPIMIGWANNWAYANKTPTAPWRGAMSIPRGLSLRQTDQGIRLFQKPLDTLRSLREEEKHHEISGKQLELEVEITLALAKEAGIKVLKSGDEETIIGYRVETGELFLDRTHSGNVRFHKDFASIESVKVKPVNGKIKLHIFIDQSIVEVFANDGEQTISDLVFTTRDDAKVETYSKHGEATFNIKAWKMKSVWRQGNLLRPTHSFP